LTITPGADCVSIDETLVARLHRQAHGERWRVTPERFARALEASAGRAFAGRTPAAGEVERYLSSLHLEDLALACACANGDEPAWEHFVLVQRPLLYRAADSLDPGGGARDLADSLYADLFGLGDHAGERQSLFRYFHGRSTLTTWLRAVLAQRHVDRLRTQRRHEGLPDENSPAAIEAPARSIDPEHHRYAQLLQRALKEAIATLQARDRLRLACYYAQQLTLAQTGRMLGESEATSSRQLARTRAAIKTAIEHQLKADGLTRVEIDECFASVSEDAGPLDLKLVIGDSAAHIGASTPSRKKSAANRSG
jgi:RNA polymerase sigma-70 factor (ECF subfamily)